MTAGMMEHYSREHAASRMEEFREAPALSLRMVENAGPGGELPVPALPELVISQSVGSVFRFHCDFGAGPVSGHAAPMDFVLVAPGVASWCRIEDWHRTRMLGIPADLARRHLGRDDDDPLDFGILHTRHNSDPLVAHALHQIWQELALGDDTSRLFLDTAVAVLLVRLERLAHRGAAEARQRGGLAPSRSSRVIEYMQANLHRNPSLAELAALADLSPWHFARSFRTSHGMPPHRYLTRLRLQKARELLEHTEWSVTEIAAATGYSPQQLTRQFRHHTGYGPRAYRRDRTVQR